MAGIFDSEVGKKATIGAKLDVQTHFDCQITHKAISRDQAVTLGLDVPEKYTVWPVDFCNTEIDRHNERFTKSVLDVFANQMNARSFTFNLFHRSDKGIGKTLKKATVEPNGAGFVLKGFIAISDKAKLPDQDITVNDAITDGIYIDVSVEVMGTTEYVSDAQGERGVWEYYNDPTRPGRTQFIGAALVNLGAQPGATIVKSIGTIEKEVKLSENMTFTEKAIGGGKKYALEYVDGKLKGLDAMEADLDAYQKSATDAIAEKTTAVTKATELEAELKALRTPIETQILLLQTVLKEAQPKTADDLVKLKAADLHTLHKGLVDRADSGSTKEKAIEKSFHTEREFLS